MLEKIKENQTIETAVDWFVKAATIGTIVVGGMLILQALFDLSWTVSLGL